MGGPDLPTTNWQPLAEEWRPVTRNVFCPTGPGGGVKPDCSPGGAGTPHTAPAHAAKTLDSWMGDYEETNAAARAGRVTPAVKAMDEVLAASPPLAPGSTFYRGVSLDTNDPAHRYVLENLKKGYSFQDQGFASVSSSEKVAHDFAAGGDYGNKVVVFKLTPSGERLRGATVRSGLEETVLDRSATFKVTGVTRSAGKILVSALVYKV